MDEQTRSLLERVRTFAIPEGRLSCRRFKFRQIGELRLAPGKPWLPFTAVQTCEARGIEFSWRARVRMMRVLWMDIADKFECSHGSLTVRLLGIVPIADSIGPAIDAGEGMRGLAEMPFHPLGFSDSPNLMWETSPTGDLRCTFEVDDRRLAVDFEIGSEGGVRGIRAIRPRSVGKGFVDTPWLGTFADYVMIEGVRVPSRVEVTWQLPEGPFTWFRARIEGFRAIA